MTNAAPPAYVLYVFGVCLLAGIVRLLSRWTVFHHTVVMFALGALFGYLSRNYDAVHLYVNIEFLTTAKLLQVHTLLLPVVILEYLFSMDPRVFLSCSPIAVMTVILDYVLNMLLQGLFVFYFLSFYHLPSNPIKTGLIYLLVGSLTSVTDTAYVVNTFYKMGSYWVLVKLMEIKRVISLVGACVVYIFVVYAHELDYDIGWYNVVVFLLFQFFASPALGWLAAQFVIFWLQRLYNDIGVEITVSIAVAYLLYYFGTVNITAKPMVSAIGVVVYALLLNNRRTCFSLGLDTFLYKLSRILAYVVKTVIFTIAGFLITFEDFSTALHSPMVLLPNILVSLTLYVWCLICRGIICVCFSPVLRRCGYKLSWQELSTMVYCNVTGTVCLITGVAACNMDLSPLFFNERHIQYMLMFHLGVLAVIRSLVAGTLFGHVMMVLGMRRVSLGRYVAMKNALQKVQEQVNTSARSYKFDRFLADADWETVYKFTNFDNPYKDLSRYSVVEQAMNLDSELLGDVRLNLLQAQKMSFWRQHEQGLLSLRALRILLEECYLAEWKVTTSSYDIGDQIRKHYDTEAKGLFNLMRAITIRFEQMQEIRRLVIAEIELTVTKLWKKRLFKIGWHVSFEIILIIAVLCITVMTIFVLLYESNCPADFSSTLIMLFFVEFNTAFMLLFSVYIILKLIVFKWRYLVLFGSVFNIILFIFGWIDICVIFTTLLSPVHVCSERIQSQGVTASLMFHKILLVARCLRLLILFEDKTYIIVHAMKRRMLLRLQLGYDVGKAYVYCKEDVHQTAAEFVAQSSTLEDIQRELQSSRVQLMRELATVQKKYPGIVVSVKSQEACRRMLNVAKETVNQLQRNGRVDAYEADMLDEMIKLRLKRLNSMPAKIDPPSVEVLISKLPWVNGDETLTRFLHFNSRLFNMAEGESADFDTDPTAGLYILVSGLIRVNWTIGDPYGKLLQPIHASSQTSVHTYNKTILHDFLTTGCTFGELALLTETPIVIDAVCETTVLMYHIPYESIQTALDWVTEPSLEWRLWHIAAVRLSIPLLKALPSYYNSSLEDLKVLTDHGSLIFKRLENQFQDGANEEKFSLAGYLSSYVILIHGRATKSGETFTGPIIIPPDNDELVFSSLLSDVYVLYIVPHRTGGMAPSVGFGYSVSASDHSSAGGDTSKETTGQLAVPARVVATATKLRGRRKSVTGTALKQLDRPTTSPPLRFLIDDTIADIESATEISKNEEEGLEEFRQTPDTLSLKSHPRTTKPDSMRPVSISPASVKHIEDTEPTEGEEGLSVRSPSPTVQTDPINEEVNKVPASPPKRAVVDQQTQQETAKETEHKKVTAIRDDLTQVQVVPRRSSSEITYRPSWTEAWKYVEPQVTLTLTPQKPAMQQTSRTPVATPKPTTGERDPVDRTVGRETAGTAPTYSREVTDTSTPRPVSDVNRKNENVNNSTNANNSAGEMRTRSNRTTAVASTSQQSSTSVDVSSAAAFQRDAEGNDGTAAEETAVSSDMPSDAVSAESSDQTWMMYGPDDDTSDVTSIAENGAEPELDQSDRSSASNLLTAGKSFDGRNDDEIDLETSPADTLADEAITATSSDLHRQSPIVKSRSASRPDDLTGRRNETVHISDELQTMTSEPERALPSNEVAHVVHSHDVENSALLTSQTESELFTAAKPAVPKLPDITTSKPRGETAAKRTDGASPREPSNAVAKPPNSRRNVGATTSSSSARHDSDPVGHSAAPFATTSKRLPTAEGHRHLGTAVEPSRPPSSTSDTNTGAGPSAQTWNQNVRRETTSAAKRVTKRDIREKKSPIGGVRNSQSPVDRTMSSAVESSSKTAEDEQSNNRVESK